VVKIGSVTSKFKKGVCGIFATKGKKTVQKLAYPTEYLSNYWTDLYRTFSIGSRVYENYKTSISVFGRSWNVAMVTK